MRRFYWWASYDLQPSRRHGSISLAYPAGASIAASSSCFESEDVTITASRLECSQGGSSHPVRPTRPSSVSPTPARPRERIRGKSQRPGYRAAVEIPPTRAFSIQRQLLNCPSWRVFILHTVSGSQVCVAERWAVAFPPMQVAMAMGSSKGVGTC